LDQIRGRRLGYFAGFANRASSTGWFTRTSVR